MFTCNDLNLLTFTYYLKYTLAFNMTIIPFLYLFINYILIVRKKQKELKIDKVFLKKRLKPTFYIIVLISLSMILHNMLNNQNNICYMHATTNVYKEYKRNYELLKDKDLDPELKTMYLENILTKKNNIDINNLVNQSEKEKIIVSSLDNKSNYLRENDSNLQNSVYVLDGVFYYPKYVYKNKTSYSGMNCPNDPLKAGYNNPYGYNNYFYTRLTNFIEEANKNGYKITMSTQGCRSYETQKHYYNTMTYGRAAKPGLSLHGFGIASDLEFYQSDGSVCLERNDYNCPSMGWAHQNADKFGLTFPLLFASYKEDWHIEPISKQTY